MSDFCSSLIQLPSMIDSASSCAKKKPIIVEMGLVFRTCENAGWLIKIIPNRLSHLISPPSKGAPVLLVLQHSVRYLKLWISDLNDSFHLVDARANVWKVCEQSYVAYVFKSMIGTMCATPRLFVVLCFVSHELKILLVKLLISTTCWKYFEVLRKIRSAKSDYQPLTNRGSGPKIRGM